MSAKMQSLRIGITIGLNHAQETLWNNGIKQNAVFLAETLKNCPNVASVVLVNTTDIPITPALPWDLTRWCTQNFNEVKNQLDILIELGGQISAEQTAYLKNRGVRLISYCCGFEYVHMTESILFERAKWGNNLFINQHYDDIWMVPQVAHISQPYFEVFRRQQARIVPFVWSPVFLLQKTATLPQQGLWQIPTDQQGWRLSVMEPNIDVVKFCLYPILIAELTYRSHPESIAVLQVCNALNFAKNNFEFISLMNYLDIVQANKAVFTGRHETPDFLANYTDAILSHQWENPLNYFYLEVCWQGYPLIHNASLISNLGYYYPENNLEFGSCQLQKAMTEHGINAKDYLNYQRQIISQFLPDNPNVISNYMMLLEQVMSKPLR